MAHNATPPPWLSAAGGFIRPYVNKQTGERLLYLEATSLPAELCPQAIGILPVHLNDEHLIRNMDQIEKEIPDEISKLCLLPFPVYSDGLAFLLTTPDGLPPVLNRTTPLDTTSHDWVTFTSEEHCRDAVTSLYDVYRQYTLAMTWLNTHVNITSTPEAKKRLDTSRKLLSWRTHQLARKFQQDVESMAGVSALKEKLGKANAYLTQHYSLDMALQFELVAFRYNISVMRAIQLFVVELVGIDPLQMEKHHLYLSLARPPVDHISDQLQKVMACNARQLATLEVQMEDPESKDKAKKTVRLYDEQHIKAHEVDTKPGHVNPSLAFQMMIYVISDVHLPLSLPVKAV